MTTVTRTDHIKAGRAQVVIQVFLMLSPVKITREHTQTGMYVDTLTISDLIIDI